MESVNLLDGGANAYPRMLAAIEGAQTEAWIQRHFANSRSLSSLETNSSWQRWLIDPLGHLLAWLMSRFSRVVVSRERRKHFSRAHRP
jgi:hypothetical protein